jgi:hypothetical protein
LLAALLEWLLAHTLVAGEIAARAASLGERRERMLAVVRRDLGGAAARPAPRRAVLPLLGARHARRDHPARPSAPRSLGTAPRSCRSPRR